MTRYPYPAKLFNMNRVIPTLKNGNLNLVISETVCIDPREGLELALPINSEKIMTIFIEFESKENQPGKIETLVEGDVLKIKCRNFLNMLGVSLNSPLRFAIGNVWFLIRMYGFSNVSNNLLLTISIFREGETNV